MQQIDHTVRSSLFAFLLSRLLILFVVVLTANVVLDPPVPGPIGELHNSNISLRNNRVVDVVRSLTLGADSLWIITIAKDGYEKEPFNTTAQKRWAFLALFPSAEIHR